MKKLFTIVLAFVLTFVLAACGCQAQETAPTTVATVPATTVPVTTAPTTEATIPSTMEPMDPTIETNIPDPDVDNSTPGMTEDSTESTGSEEMPSGDTARSRMRMK